jgi:hypothetical protein
MQAALFAPASADTPNVPSNDYLNALQAADGFAWAWAHRDASAGAMLVAPALRAKLGQSALATYFQGTSTPQHWAFEIGPGTRAGASAFRFPVRLLSYLPAGGGFTQATASRIMVLSKGAGGHWYVATLP